jgi:hypothetical protein
LRNIHKTKQQNKTILKKKRKGSKTHTYIMMIRVYCAALVVVEIPTIMKLLQGGSASAISQWFPTNTDSAEFNAVYAGWLLLLCISRTMVIAYPKNRGILFNAASVHAVEIPLYGFLAYRLGFGGLSWLSRGILGAILLNPLFFLQAALQARNPKS